MLRIMIIKAKEGDMLNRHSFTYEQYCTAVGKNIILEEITYHDGKRVLRCLYHHRCEKTGGCSNKYVIERINKTRNA